MFPPQNFSNLGFWGGTNSAPPIWGGTSFVVPPQDGGEQTTQMGGNTKFPPHLGGEHHFCLCFPPKFPPILSTSPSPDVPPQDGGEPPPNRWGGNTSVSPPNGGNVPPLVPPQNFKNRPEMGGNKKSVPPHLGGQCIPWPRRVETNEIASLHVKPICVLNLCVPHVETDENGISTPGIHLRQLNFLLSHVARIEQWLWAAICYLLPL